MVPRMVVSAGFEHGRRQNGKHNQERDREDPGCFFPVVLLYLQDLLLIEIGLKRPAGGPSVSRAGHRCHRKDGVRAP